MASSGHDGDKDSAVVFSAHGDCPSVGNQAHGFKNQMRRVSHRVFREYGVLCLAIPPIGTFLSLLISEFDIDRMDEVSFSWIWYNRFDMVAAIINIYVVLMIALIFLALCRTLLQLLCETQEDRRHRLLLAIDCDSKGYLLFENIILFITITFNFLPARMIAIFAFILITCHSTRGTWTAIIVIIGFFLINFVFDLFGAV